MSAGAKYLADKLLGWITNTAFPAVPANLYLALFTTATGPNAEGTEVTGGSYARVAIAAATGWVATSGAPPDTAEHISNVADLVFPTATVDWGVVTHWALHDASTAGNRVAFGPLASAQSVVSGRIFKVLAGQLVVSVA